MGRTGGDTALLRKVAQGEYVVDERAVAEAILGRIAPCPPRISSVLVPAELFADALGADELEPGSGLSLA